MISVISVILDIVTACIFIVPIFWGLVQGVKRCGFSLISLAVSTAAAFTVSGLFAGPVYEKFFQDGVYEFCYKAAEDYDLISETSRRLSDYGIEASEEDIRKALTSAESLPESVGDLARSCGADESSALSVEEDIRRTLSSDIPREIENMLPKEARYLTDLDLSSGEVYDAARACAVSPQEAADYVESSYAAPIVTAMIKTALFILTSAVMSLIMRLAYFIFKIEFYSPETAGERAGGAALGMLVGAVNVVIFAAVAGSVEQACEGFFNIEQLDSKIFLPIFNILY